MISEWLYDKNNDAKIYLDEDKFINHNEQQIGILEGRDVYSMDRETIGFFENGVLYDTDNRPVAFIETAKGYIPSLPEIIGDPGSPDFTSGEESIEYSDESGVTDFSGSPGGPGESGAPLHPIEGGWSDVTVEELFGIEL